MQDLAPLFTKGTLPPCELCHMRALGFCSNSSIQTLLALEKSKTCKSYRAGTTIAHTGDNLSHVGTIMYGVVSLAYYLNDGRRQSIGMLHSGSFLGRPGPAKSAYTIEAMTDVELCGFDKKTFEKLLHDAPELHARLLEMMLAELDFARDWMLTLGRKTAREKLCSLFVNTAYQQNRKASKCSNDGEVLVDLPMTREQMADFLSLTTETISRQFGQLKNEGLIQNVSKQTYKIQDFRLLLEEAGDDCDGSGLF